MPEENRYQGFPDHGESEDGLPRWFYGSDGKRYLEPAYRVINNGVYMDDTLWLEGEEIIFDGCPNDSLEPLNAAAEERMLAWKRSLPDGGKTKFEDMVQAAWEMRPKEGIPELAQADFYAAVIKRATEMRISREGGPAPPTPFFTVPKNNANAPPMANMAGEVGSPTTPGPRHDPAVKHMPQDGHKRVQKLPPVMGNLRPASSQGPTS
jgi:hypothetical protein